MPPPASSSSLPVALPAKARQEHRRATSSLPLRGRRCGESSCRPASRRPKPHSQRCSCSAHRRERCNLSSGAFGCPQPSEDSAFCPEGGESRIPRPACSPVVQVMPSSRAQSIGPQSRRELDKGVDPRNAGSPLKQANLGSMQGGHTSHTSSWLRLAAFAGQDQVCSEASSNRRGAPSALPPFEQRQSVERVVVGGNLGIAALLVVSLRCSSTAARAVSSGMKICPTVSATSRRSYAWASWRVLSGPPFA